ncbi:MAG: tRNA adenosine(34) deaminase TadA [Phycisphaerales bacterium]|nr:tRNA adenosine(34) deaminase TadA [Phycisphaerales bacterium]
MTSHQPGADQASEIDLAMMRRAIELGRRAAEDGEVPIAAVIYDGETCIAEGWNRRETDHDASAHAEIVAIRNAGTQLGHWRLHGLSMAVTLEPCPMCAGALVNARLDRLIYGADDPKAGACRTLYEIPTDTRLNHRLQVIGGVLADDCVALLRDFFQARR